MEFYTVLKFGGILAPNFEKRVSKLNMTIKINDPLELL